MPLELVVFIAGAILDRRDSDLPASAAGLRSPARRPGAQCRIAEASRSRRTSGSGVTTNPLREIFKLPLRAAELEPDRRVGARLHSRCDQVAIQPGYSKIASCVSGVSPLSFKANRPPALATAAGRQRVQEPVHDVERVLPKVRHLPAGVIPEPAEMIERPVGVVRPLRGRAQPHVVVELRGRRLHPRGEPKPGMTLR